jgi:hypothetical protein
LAGKQLADGRDGAGRSGGHHLSRDLAHGFVAIEIVLVRRIGETTLRDRL